MKLPPFMLERYFAEHEFTAERLLCCSDCESMSVRELLSLEPGAEEELLSLRLGYTQSRGSPRLRALIAGVYTGIDPEQVLVHAGAQEAIFLFMHAALEPSGHLIVHWPCYQSLFEIARGIGCSVTPWRAREEMGWALDPEELKGLIRPNTRAIILNSPHNPTGWQMPRDAFLQTVGISEANGIPLFSDEVYREAEYDAKDRLPAACDAGELGVSLGVMSKTYGLPGLRIGWAATRNRELYRRMEELKDYTTICGSAPSELLAEVALRHRNALVERSVGTITRNLAVLDGLFARHADRLVWRRPKAGPIGFPGLLQEDSKAFCEGLLRQTGVLLLPGSVYADGGNHFRIGFGRDGLSDAVARLEAYLDASPAGSLQ
jgi:aspartate/methionine/tyrosine aminotransferase